MADPKTLDADTFRFTIEPRIAWPFHDGATEHLIDAVDGRVVAVFDARERATAVKEALEAAHDAGVAARAALGLGTDVVSLDRIGDVLREGVAYLIAEKGGGAGSTAYELAQKVAAEKARADAAEQRVVELRAAAVPMMGWCGRSQEEDDDLGALQDALTSTANIAGRWVSRREFDELREIRSETSRQLNRALDERDAAIARAEKAEARVATLTTLAEKVDVIRNGIVGMQGFHFSEHGYPLVAALDEAGYPGVGYKIARENLGTLIEQTKAAIAARDEAVARLEATRDAWAGDAKMAWATINRAERARDEVGIQLAAAQAEIARLRPVVLKAAEMRDLDSDMLPPRVRRLLGELRNALRALDTVPGDALAPKITAALEASGIDTANVKGGE